jgi:hypothetical protein
LVVGAVDQPGNRAGAHQLLPSLTYLTRFDYFMLASMLMVFTTLVIVTAGAYFTGTGQLERAGRLDRWARHAFPVVFGFAFVLSWWA